MKTQKLSLNDFEAVGTAELLEIKGGNRFIVTPDNFRRTYLNGPINNDQNGGCEGGKKGDTDPWGGTVDIDEVVVTADFPACYACSDRDSPRPAWQKGWGTLFRDTFLHRTGCPDSL